MDKAMDLLLMVLTGGLAGLVAGGLLGTLAGFLAGYQSDFAQMFDHNGRTAIAKTALRNGRAIGSLAGLMSGILASALGLGLASIISYFAIGRLAKNIQSEESCDYIMGGGSGMFVGAMAGLVAGYIVRLRLL